MSDGIQQLQHGSRSDRQLQHRLCNHVVLLCNHGILQHRLCANILLLDHEQQLWRQDLWPPSAQQGMQHLLFNGVFNRLLNGMLNGMCHTGRTG